MAGKSGPVGKVDGHRVLSVPRQDLLMGRAPGHWRVAVFFARVIGVSVKDDLCKAAVVISFAKGDIDVAERAAVVDYHFVLVHVEIIRVDHLENMIKGYELVLAVKFNDKLVAC